MTSETTEAARQAVDAIPNTHRRQDLEPAATDDGLAFTAIDFETANRHRGSVCAVGMAKVRGGRIVDTFSSLICPPAELGGFEPRNIDIHHISADDVDDAPTWEELYGSVLAFAGEDDLVAHNAVFDRSVMQHACGMYDLDRPANRWRDTLSISKNMLTLGA